jgi:hypothetical protein
VWVKPELRDDGRVYWTADSDSQLTKGLAALLVLGLSGCTPQVRRGQQAAGGGLQLGGGRRARPACEASRSIARAAALREACL